MSSGTRSVDRTEAYRHCRANAGAPGVDGISFDKIEAWGRKQWLEGIMQELCSGAYRPQPLLRVWIPKSNGGQRPLGIPPIRDRVVQMAVVLVLVILHSHAEAYRPSEVRRALRALRA